MSNKITAITAGAAVTALMLTAAPAFATGNDQTSNQFGGAVTQRIDGKNRVETNMKILQAKYGNSKLPHVYIARADLGFDALSAKPLATKDPVMLVDTHGTPETAAQQLAQFGVQEATIIGGPGAIPDTFANKLGVKIRERIWGMDRYATNLAVARKAYPTPQTIFVTNGNGMGDGLAATASALTQYGPVLFTDPRGYNNDQKNYIETNPNATITTIGNAPDYPVGQHRISRVGFSQTPQQVSALVAKQTFPSGNDKMYIARSDTLADAISAANISDGPVLLVDPAGFPADAILAAKDLQARTVIALGGTGAIPDTVLNQFAIKTTIDSPQKPGTKPGDTGNHNWAKPSGEGGTAYLKDNPGWENPDQYYPQIDQNLAYAWQTKGDTPATPIYDPALDRLAATGTGTGTKGMLVITINGTGTSTPAGATPGIHFSDQWHDPAYGTQPGDIARTAKGDYTITKITYGRHIISVEPIPSLTGGPKDMIGIQPIWVIKIEGTLAGSNTPETIDASGITAIVRDGKTLDDYGQPID